MLELPRGGPGQPEPGESDVNTEYEGTAVYVGVKLMTN